VRRQPDSGAIRLDNGRPKLIRNEHDTRQDFSEDRANEIARLHVVPTQALKVRFGNVSSRINELSVSNILQSDDAWTTVRVVAGLEVRSEWPVHDSAPVGN
jgi:hypothetical protein